MVAAAANPGAFLAEALARQGPQGLPYDKNSKFAIRQHLLELVQDFPTLTIKVQGYMHTDGRCALSLKFPC